MSTVIEQFTLIIAGLRAAVANSSALRSINLALAARDAPRTALLVLAWHRIGRMAQRFEALYASWRAGTLPKPRASRAGQARPARAYARLPSRRTWLVALVGYHAAGRGSQLQHLLAQPDMAEFLKAAPQATRILRPLCHMLGLPETALPSRPRTARAPRPAPARPSRPGTAPPPVNPPIPRRTRPKPPLQFSPA